MKAIKVIRRPNWQRHIRDNAYQADVLSDRQQKYWIEALAQPFVVQFTTEEESAIVAATESLGEMCVEFLDWFLLMRREAKLINVWLCSRFLQHTGRQLKIVGSGLTQLKIWLCVLGLT